MAVYKVIQNIEAEDKLLGPLTLKGFIYFIIAGVLGFINLRILISGGPIYVRLPIVLVLVLPMLLFGVLASPLGRDQPTEVWLLSHVRFLLKSRLRNWDQSGIEELVTITAPKRPEQHLTKDFDANEAKSRLQALAVTLDSRGWAIKNSAVNLNTQSDYLRQQDADSDRLIAPSSISEPAAVIDVHPSDDILDEENNATAQKFNQMVQEADNQRKKAVQDKINEARASLVADQTTQQATTADPRLLNNSGAVPLAPTTQLQPVQPSSNALSTEDQALLEFEHNREAEIKRLSASFHPKNQKIEPTSPPKTAPGPVVTTATQAVKLKLAQSGNAFSVASVASLASSIGQPHLIGPGEVEVRLH